MRISKGKKLVLFLTLCISVLLCACQNPKAPETELQEASVPAVSGTFSVSIFDVGKADAIFLQTTNHTVVIDCGEKGDAEDLVASLEEKGVKKIDYLFITHFDKDHVGGVPGILEKMDVGEIIVPDYEGNNSAYTNYLSALQEKNISPAALTETMVLTLDDVLFEVFPPLKASYVESDNDYSLVISASHGENRFLFTGDAEAERLKELPSQFSLKHDFLKVPHHGRFSDSTKDFLTGTAPDYAVITCSKKNPPEQRVLDLLSSLDVEVFLTENGTVHAVSDGKNITLTQEKKE